MAGVGLFAYLGQKIFVTILRLLATPLTFFAKRRDRLLGVSKYNAVAQHVKIPSRDQGRSIKATLYAPPSSTSGSPKPVLVNWHGSGFILPLHGSDALYCSQIAQEAGIFVLDADYRKAPEDRFPAAVHDVEDALKWVGTQTDRFDASRVAVSGFSAGGNLAVVAASVLRKELKEKSGVDIKTLAAIYPVTDISLDPAAKTVPHPIRPITPFMANMFNDCYVPDKEVRKDPRVSPSLGDLSTFPETVIMITGAGDILAPEADALAEKLENGQRKVLHRNFKGMHHGFDKGAKEGTRQCEGRDAAYALVVKGLRESLGS